MIIFTPDLVAKLPFALGVSYIELRKSKCFNLCLFDLGSVRQLKALPERSTKRNSSCM